MIEKNSYPNVPEVKTVFKIVSGLEVGNYIKSTGYPDAVKQATFAIKAAESVWNGNVINNNLFDIQADFGK